MIKKELALNPKKKIMAMQITEIISLERINLVLIFPRKR